MYIWLILAFIFTGLELLALRKDWLHLEYVAKPAVMVCLFIWLVLRTGLQGNVLWFGAGILFSLLGGVLLMISLDHMFLFGLIIFLLAHLSYITGFKEQLLNPTSWSFILLLIILINVMRLIRRIVGAMRAKRENALVNPVIVYSLVISLMLYAAMSTIFDPAWKTDAALFVSVGAFLFFLSDLILAWNRFVSPVQIGRILNSVTYHLGQIS
jgi:uncharacterized membrane protein YhhN